MIRTVIADDEVPARRKLRELLEREPDVTIVGEAADGREVVALLAGEGPVQPVGADLVLLDIEMPRMNGLEVVETVGVDRMPLVVFITAHEEHTLRAFEVHALDYLLKPFGPSRLARTLTRVRDQLASLDAAGLQRRLESLLAGLRAAGETGTPDYPRPIRHLLVERSPGRQVLLPVDGIRVIRANRNRVQIVTADETMHRRETLTSLESRLDRDMFLRINRSEIVRLDAIREIQSWFHGDARVVLDDGTVLTWSRRYRSRSGRDL